LLESADHPGLLGISFTLVALMIRSVLLAVLAFVMTSAAPPISVAREAGPLPAPEFTHSETQDWLNSPPLKLQNLQGHVVLIDFWTFDCWNCYRSFPWLKSLEEKYTGREFKVIGVHTPEFAHEKVRANVARKIAEFGLHHPVMIDNDFSYWNAMGNRYWPAFYLIDRQGRLRGQFFGETHKGTCEHRRSTRRSSGCLRIKIGTRSEDRGSVENWLPDSIR
jgi:thiol-disulfide isomerase/thioredoxin